MDGRLGTGDAIARDWELPELPSGTPTIPSTPSLPTSEELAEIFGNSDDEDEDLPFSLSTDLQITPSLASAGGPDTKQFSNSSVYSSTVGQERSLFLGQLGDSLVPMTAEVGGVSEQLEEGVNETRKDVPQSPTKGSDVKEDVSSTGVTAVRKSSRLNSRQQQLRSEDTKPTKLPEEKPKTQSKKGAEVAAQKSSPQEDATVRTVAEEDKVGEEEKEEEKEEEEGEDSDDEEGSISDDPDRLWCVCKKPHNDRFMICCDQCEEWFHGDCVGITVSQGKRMERAGKEYICPICIERGKLEKEVRAANRMARQAKREELKEAKLKSKTASEKQTNSIKQEAHPHRRKSSSSYPASLSKDGSSDQYGLELLFQPDNAPPRPPSSDGAPAGKEDGTAAQEGGVGRRRRAFYREELTATAPCLAPQCSAQATAPSRYCSEACIEKYAEEALKKLASRGITFEASPSEFIRGSKGISMVDKASGKTVIGIQAPTDKTLVSWLKQHQSYEVLLPAGKPGKGASSQGRSSRSKTEEGGEGRRGGGGETREGESPTKQRSLNDPVTVRTNAKKALLQTLWRRKEAVDDVMVTQDEVELIAKEIEEQLYGLHGEINTKYKTKYRSLLFNLKDTKNQGLFRKVCLREISATDLVRMKSEQYASDELAEWREKTLKKDLDKIVEREEEARTSKKVIRKITYKGEVEIEAERTEAIETIVAPSEEMAVTPSTPLTPTATKLAVQSFDVVKASDSGTKTTGKQDSQTDTKAKPASATKQDGQKNKQSKDKQKSANPSKSETTSASELKAANDDIAKKDTDQDRQSGVLLDLLTDTTSEHGSHIYHPHCQICLGKKPALPQTGSTKDEDDQHSSTEYENVDDMQTESYYGNSSLPPPIPLLWEGLIDMPGTVVFSSSAYPVSGSTDYIATILPSTLHVMGRIAHVQVWDYVDKLRTSSSREIVVLRFDWTAEERDGYESLLNYLIRKHRCGVIDEQLPDIKDFYLVPLMVDQEVPSYLLPFNGGPGLPEDRPNLLLGVIVQTKGIKPLPSTELSISASLANPVPSSTGSLKRHLSTSSDDHATDVGAPKQKRRQVEVGFGGQTPPLLDKDDETSSNEPMDVSDSATLNRDPRDADTRLQVAFYGKHQPVSESHNSAPKPSGIAAPPSGIKSILSQLSDEKLKELASAMSNIEESTSTPASSEAGPSTVTSPATGQMVTASSLSAPSHSAPIGAHQPPHFSQLQRPPLHPPSNRSADVDSRGPPHNVAAQGPPSFPPSGAGQPAPNTHPHQHSYSSDQQYSRGTASSNYNWDSSQHYQSRPNGPPNSYNVGGPPQNSGPPSQNFGPSNQYSSPHLGSQQQYSGPPTQHGGGPPNQYSAPPPHQGPQHAAMPPPQHSSPPQQYSMAPGPPTNQQPQHHGQPQHPSHQYPGAPQEHSGGAPHQNTPPYSSNYEPRPQQPPHYPNPNQHHGNNPGYNQGPPEWSCDPPPPGPPQSYSRRQHYYESESRLDQLQSHDYGHRSQPPKHSWKPGGDAARGWQGRQEFGGRRDRGRR